jgi:hypothetical protein
VRLRRGIQRRGRGRSGDVVSACGFAGSYFKVIFGIGGVVLKLPGWISLKHHVGSKGIGRALALIFARLAGALVPLLSFSLLFNRSPGFLVGQVILVSIEILVYVFMREYDPRLGSAYGMWAFISTASVIILYWLLFFMAPGPP